MRGLAALRRSACTSAGRPNIAAEKTRSPASVPRKKGIAAVKQVSSPAKLRAYMVPVAQTKKLLIRKNDSDAVSEAPSTRATLVRERSIPLPSKTMAAYHSQVKRK